MAVEMKSNADKMAAASRIDGFKMLWRDVPGDELQRRREYLLNMVRNNTECEPGELTKHVKVKVFRGSGEKGGGLCSVQVTGAAAEVFYHLPWSWAVYVSEIHAKCYADETNQGATDAFSEAVFKSAGSAQTSFFGASTRKNTPKAGGSRGTRIGANKSDAQTIVYRRARERTGIETRVKDQTLFRLWAQTSDLADQLREQLGDPELMQHFKWLAAKHGFAKFSAELKRRGVRLTDFFSGVTYHPTDAGSPATVYALNPAEDNSVIS